MVANSPMRVKGNLYAGKKNDHWLALKPDPPNNPTATSPVGGGDEVGCTAVTADKDSNSNLLFVGKTEYSLTIVDGTTGKESWNVSYVAYQAPEIIDPNFEYEFYSCSSNGLFSVVDKRSGEKMWHARFTSPVITVFVERFGSLLRVPHRTLAADTMTSHLLGDIPGILPEEGPGSSTVGCLFIGKFLGGIYALAEIMHKFDVETPRPRYAEIGPADPRDVKTIGHHVRPMLPRGLVISEAPDNLPSNKGTRAREALPPAEEKKGEDPLHTYLNILVGIIAILVTVMIGVIVLLLSMLQKVKSESNTTNILGATLNHNNKVSKHTLSVGKIDIYMSEIIGHGSEGTVVFKGQFEKRDVAVKRVLLDFIDIDLHEVELLRQADEHPNVIRYFCMETDSMFRYIALEMCRASLRQYVEGDIFVKDNAQNKSLLEQTIAGIQHLHSLNIVHRDIKPGNILITKGQKTGLKALISDFGLCRKISDGRQSMTARTGSAGTDGWIAPEMLLPSSKISHAVDVFSYGCIMYYVLSEGQHPFGNDVFRRQNNILNNDYDLSELSAQTQDNVLAASLIVQMVGSKDKYNRPTASAIYMHPYFWSAGKILRFYSDVSDRVEKEETSDLVLRWEHNSPGPVLRGGWMIHCPELQNDLYKYRKYKSASVRDLLRAMRNKRHHYRELPVDVQQSLGDIPDGFLMYFSSRFPRLLLHTYTIMWQCRKESIFRAYYPEVRANDRTNDRLIFFFCHSRAKLVIRPANFPTIVMATTQMSNPLSPPQVATYTEQRQADGEQSRLPVALDCDGKYSTEERVPDYSYTIERRQKRKQRTVHTIDFKPTSELSARVPSREPTPEPHPSKHPLGEVATLKNKFGLLETQTTDSETENTPPRPPSSTSGRKSRSSNSRSSNRSSPAPPNRASISPAVPRVTVTHSPPPGFDQPREGVKPWFESYELTPGYGGSAVESVGPEGLIHRNPRTYLVPEM
eukprot:sb/3461671/